MIETIERTEQTKAILRELCFSVRHSGYRQLCLAIPLFAQEPNQSLTKQLYPTIAKHFGCSNAFDVECAIRRAILHAWNQGDRNIWNLYFPRCDKAPSNMTFIATIAEHLR